MILRIALVLATVLAAHTSAEYLLTWQAMRDLSREVDQLSIVKKAKGLESALRPLVTPHLHREAVINWINEQEKEDERIRWYLIDGDGQVVVSSSTDRPVSSHLIIDLEPISRFIRKGRIAIPINAEDPRSPGVKRPFTATTIEIEGRPGYLYGVVEGEEYKSDRSSYRAFRATREYHTNMILVYIGSGSIALLAVVLIIRPFIIKGLEEQEAKADTQRLTGMLSGVAEEFAQKVREIHTKDGDMKTFVAAISHDLRGPLATIKAYVDTLSESGAALGGEQRQKYLATISESADDVAAMIEQLLDVVRFEVVEEGVLLEQIQAYECMESVLARFSPIAGEKKILLSGVFKEVSPVAVGDLSLTTRALGNIVQNAIRYTDPGGSVTLSARAEKGQVVFSIVDTGQGIEESELPHIFDRFFRGKGGRGAPGKSTGLGLYIVKRAIELQGGTLTVRSDVGKGTTFEFSLPEEGA